MYYCRKKEYAKDYIEIQVYENLLSLSDAMEAGTIFMDLVRPYKKSKKGKC